MHLRETVPLLIGDEEKKTVSASALIFAARESKLGIYTLHVPPEVHLKLALR